METSLEKVQTEVEVKDVRFLIEKSCMHKLIDFISTATTNKTVNEVSDMVDMLRAIPAIEVRHQEEEQKIIPV